jgi:hypothetical protein
MRKLLTAALAGATALGAAAMAGTVQAQPYGYYYNPPVARAYDPYTGRYYDPAPAYRPAPQYAPYNGYGSNDSLSAGLSVLGSALGLSAGGYDQYGYDPNGMIAPDGHRIKCKNRRVYDDYYRGYVTRRVCR